MIRLGDLVVYLGLAVFGYTTGGLIDAVVLPGVTIGVRLTVAALLGWFSQ